MPLTSPLSCETAQGKGVSLGGIGVPHQFRSESFRSGGSCEAVSG